MASGLSRKPNKTIHVPVENRTHVLRNHGQQLANTWKTETGCEVELQFDRGQVVRIDLYGSGARINAAVRAINNWISNAHKKTPASNSWAKLPAFDPNEWYYDQVRDWEKDRKSIFTGPIPEDKADKPLFKTIVPWPKEFMTEDRSVTPRDAFGSKLEGLDTIRINDEVFINLVLQRDPPWQVEIQGYDAAHVTAGEEHYKNILEKVRAKNFLGRSTLNIILDQAEGIDVVLQKEPGVPITRAKIVPRLQPSLIDGPGRFRDEIMDLAELGKLQKDIKDALDRIRWEKGTYDFRIRFGCISLGLEDKMIGETYPVPKFKTAIDRVVPCNVRQWAFDHDSGDQLLIRLFEAHHLLEPIKTNAFRKILTLSKVRPTFRGTWVLFDPNQSVHENGKAATHNSGTTKARTSNRNTIAPADLSQKKVPNFIVVQIDWTEDEEGTYEKMPVRFYRYKHGKSCPEENMDINLLELAEGKAWHFGLESLILESKSNISPVIVSFAEQVKMKPGYGKDVLSKDSFASWMRTPSIHFHTGRLDRIYTFGIKKTGYQVEAIAMWYPNHKAPYWGISVHHCDWEMQLNQLERLPHGHVAHFGDAIKTFLPDDGNTSDAKNDKNPDEAVDLSLELQRLKLSKEEVPYPSEGVRLLIRKLMELSKVIKCGSTTGWPETGPSLGKGLIIRSSESILIP